MKYRLLGPTGLKISEISLGCSGYWGNRRFDEEVAVSVVRKAFDKGINFFDTGHNYSNFNAEPRLGLAISEILSAHGRESLVISSKGGSLLGSTSILPTPGIQLQDFRPESIEESCKRSIQNLRCDYLDIFQLHGIQSWQFTPELIDRLHSMKGRGLFRWLGVNTHDSTLMKHIASSPGLCDMVLIDYNVLQLDREPLIDALAQAGVAVVAGTILAQGHIIKSKIGSVRSGSFFWYLARSLFKPSSRRLARVSRPMRHILRSVPGMTASQAAFAYVLSNSSVSSCVFGTTQIANLIEVIASVDKCLDEKTRLEIRQTYDTLSCVVSA